MTKAHKLLTIATLMSLLILAAAACGDGDESTVADTDPPAAAQVAPTVPAESNTAPVVAATQPPATEPTSTPVPAPTPAPVEGFGMLSGRTESDPPAPELTGINSWINGEAFTVESQRGKVVLIDFWTYTCINCIRTLPYLKEWHSKYADKGLVILGVHTPEFEFEKIRENVVEAMAGFEIEYPVAQDNDFGTWRAFENRFWPAKYLIDKDGYIRYTHFGEGAYDETEDKIRELLGEAGFDLAMIAPGTDPGPLRDVDSMTGDPSMGLTRELYAGASRNYSTLMAQQAPPYVLHAEYYEGPDMDVLYEDPGSHQNHFLFLNGLWTNTEESLVHARETLGYEDYIVLMFFATSVNVVMASTDSEPVHVRITMDDAPVKPERAGVDILFDEDGNSYVSVDESRMYRVVDMDTFTGHELKLSSLSSNMEVFAFTFGSYEGGEPTS